MSDLVSEVKKRLHDRGGRMTDQRQLVLESLDGLGCHPTAEQIFELASQRDPSLNLSTVYRTLRWLEQEGFVSARRFEESGRQDRFDPALPAEHHHFICSICKQVIEFSDPAIDAIRREFERQHHVQVELISVVFTGVCRDCRPSSASHQPEAQHALP